MNSCVRAVYTGPILFPDRSVSSIFPRNMITQNYEWVIHHGARNNERRSINKSVLQGLEALWIPNSGLYNAIYRCNWVPIRFGSPVDGCKTRDHVHCHWTMVGLGMHGGHIIYLHIDMSVCYMHSQSDVGDYLQCQYHILYHVRYSTLSGLHIWMYL